ncbi:hypothetical protein [Mycolicibacterium mucogenicum]|uniref:hypothetical protein n=1 Tax=Mycolicibacterium mucogenicum TaxID=56689 RepID=UPI00076ABE28|nr:hypothetical protein [Mycolicibacterium mucogenicum]
MRAFIHYPDENGDQYCIEAEMPALPRVGELVELDLVDRYLEVTEVRWPVETFDNIAVGSAPRVYCSDKIARAGQ